MSILILDPGHEKGEPNSSPDKTYFEYEGVQSIVNIAEQMLQQYNNLQVIKTKNINDAGISLIKRADIANKANADLFISVHTNAHGSGLEWTDANGFEVFHYPGSITGNKLAKICHKHAIPKLNIKDRGIKNANFSVLRNTNMPAILIEFAFHTNKQDCEKLKSQDFRIKCAEVIVSTVLEWFQLNQNINQTHINNQHDTPILGKPQLSAYHLDKYIKIKNPNAPDVSDYYIDYGNEMGIRGDIAICQAIKETGWFKYGNDVSNTQNNFCGLGAVGNGAKGASFDTPRQGVLAHLQHLWAYASNLPLPNNQKQIDPRFHLVNRGSATTWEKLAGKWAVPGYDKNKHNSLEQAYQNGETYGQEILKIYEEIKKFNPGIEPSRKEDGSSLNKNYIEKIIKKENVFFTICKIDNSELPAIIINGKGFVGVKEIGSVFGYKALYDKVTKEILLQQRENSVADFKMLENKDSIIIKVENKQISKNKDVFYTITNINKQKILSVTIDGKGYIAAKEIGNIFGYKALYDKVDKIILLKKVD